MAFNPFHQFEIHDLVNLKISSVDFSFTNASLFMFFAVLAISLFCYFATKRMSLVPGVGQVLVETVYSFVQETLVSSTGSKGLKYFPLIFSLFCFVLTLNLLGMAPYGFTVTSHIIVTFALAMIVFLTVVLVGFINHGVHFLSIFLPKGAPIYIAPLLILIELFSFLARPLSLGVRLAGNMIAGHVLLKVIASFSILMGIYGVFPFPFIMLIVGFEIFVAILQAYIFTILACVYLNDAINLH